MRVLFVLLSILTEVTSVFGAMVPLDNAECVQWHNYYRRIHQAPDMTWSKSVAVDAQAWADYLATNNIFQHSRNRNEQGENLYARTADSQHSCRDAIKAFYREESHYDYSGRYIKGAGHFTQLVWAKSTQIGVGKAMSSNGGIYLVFRYKPAGNVLGFFDQNVKPAAKIPETSTAATSTDDVSTERPTTDNTSSVRPTTDNTSSVRPTTDNTSSVRPTSTAFMPKLESIVLILSILQNALIHSGQF